MTRTYICEGCGKTLTGTAEQAFQAGWDTPERFMSHTTCETCPINKTIWWKAVVLGQPITIAEANTIRGYNALYNEAHPQEAP